MLNLNGKDIPSFVKVNSIEFSILPPVTNNLLSIRGKMGSYLTSQTLGTKVISADITIIADKINGVLSASHEMAEWLYHKEPVKLVIDDEPDKYYRVVPDGDSTIQETVNVGQGTITFICTEPYAYGSEHTYSYSPTSTSPEYISVLGNTETQPEIELAIKENLPNINVITDDEHLMIGEPVDEDEVVSNPKPRILWDEMTNVSLWSSATYVDGGVVAGTFYSNGYSFQQTDRDYGTNADGWHGASAVRSLSKELQDFEVQASIGLTADHANDIGRVEIYLLDVNNNILGKLHLRDSAPNANNHHFEAHASSGRFAHEFRTDRSWVNFEGIVRIARRGNDWSAYIAKRDDDGNHYNHFTGFWHDYSGNTSSGLLAKVQVHVGAFKTAPIPASAYIADVKVWENVDIAESSVPVALEIGDVIKIDNEKSIVYKNGEEFYSGLNPVSTFLTFKKGSNGLSILPPSADVTVRYKERWL